MQSFYLVVLIGLLGGVAVAVQASLAGIFSQRIGLIGNGLFVFGGGFLFALAIMAFVGVDQLKPGERFRGMRTWLARSES